MDEQDHWADSPTVFLEAVEAIQKKFPDLSLSQVLTQALERGIGLDTQHASVFGRMLEQVTVDLKNMPPTLVVDPVEISRATRALNACVVVVYTYDLDYLAGYAKQDPKKIYIDRGFLRKDVAPYLVVHEVVEKCLLDFVRFPERAYQQAHQIAQYMEHKTVEAGGITWEEYQKKIMTTEIKRVTEKIRQGGIENVPPDLDLTPYIDSNDPDIKVIESLMRKGHFSAEQIADCIYHLQFTDAKRMARTLMRFQEFYESREFKDTYFTREEFEAWYQKTRGRTYEDDWAEGFKIGRAHV